MATERRLDRLQSFIMREVATMFQRGLNDPRIGEISVTRVKLSKDLRYGTIFIVCHGDEAQQRTTFRGLTSATSTVQYRLASALQIRHMPTIKFEIDSHPEKAQEMDDIFKKIAQERESRQQESSSEEEL